MSLETDVSPNEVEGGEEEKSRIPSDWDSRLAIARAKREKALSQKATKPKKKRVNRPPIALSDFDDLEDTKTAFLADDGKPITAPIVPIAAPAPAPAPAPERVEQRKEPATIAPMAPPVAAPQKRGVRQLGLVLVSCCVGLGFGFSLGLGLLIGSGWVNPQQVWQTETELRKEPSQPAVKIDATPTKIALPTKATPDPAPLVIAEPAYSDISPRILLQIPTLQEVTYTSPSFKFAEFAPVNRPVLASLTVQENVDRSFERPGHTDTTSPVTTLAVNSLGSIEPLDAVPSKPNGDVQYASAKPVPFGLPTPSKVDISFIPPAVVATPSVVQPDIQNLASPENVFSVPTRPADNTLFSQLGSPTRLQPVAKNFQLPEADQPSTVLNFAQAMGLSASGAEKYDLVLLAPRTVKDPDVASFVNVLGKTGLPLSKTVKVGFSISEPHIRYYDTETKQVAESLAQSMGITARNFVSNSNRPGLIEVWMASGSTYKPSVQITKLRKISPRTNIRTQLSKNIIRGLQVANN